MTPATPRPGGKEEGFKKDVWTQAVGMLGVAEVRSRSVGVVLGCVRTFASDRAGT